MSDSNVIIWFPTSAKYIIMVVLDSSFMKLQYICNFTTLQCVKGMKREQDSWHPMQVSIFCQVLDHLIILSDSS